MEKQTLLATLNATLREVSEKLAQSDLVLMRMRQELATFKDILQHAQQNSARADDEHEKVFTAYRELLASSAEPSPADPWMEQINRLGAEQARTRDEQLAAKELVRKYREQVRAAELGLARQESNHKSLNKAMADLTWQIKRLSAAGQPGNG